MLFTVFEYAFEAGEGISSRVSIRGIRCRESNFSYANIRSLQSGQTRNARRSANAVPIIMELMKQANIIFLQRENYEADDILGFVSHAAADHGYETIIVSGDRDSFQLASETTKILYAKKGVSDTVGLTAHISMKPIK